MRPGLAALIVWLAATAGAGHALTAQDARSDSVRFLIARLEKVAVRGGPAAYLSLLADSADRDRAREFAVTELVDGVVRAVVQERDRTALPGTLPGNGFQLLLDVFQDSGARARVATWRIDIKRLGEAGTDTEWLIADQQSVSSINNLYKLSLDPTRQFRARELKIAQDDVELTLSDGSVFLSNTDQGPAGVVLMGRGTLRFHPAPETERTQLRIFSGGETLETSFDFAMLKLNPADFDDVVAMRELVEMSVDPGDLRRAERLFRDESPKSYGLELGQLSSDTWSLLPSRGDLVAEIRTRRFDTLTYTRSSSDPEDVRLFQRGRRRTIAQYTSPEKQRASPAGTGDRDRSDFDVVHDDIDLSYVPDRFLFDGRAQLSLKVRANSVNSVALRLADSLTVRSVISAEYGPLFHMRLKNQGALLVNLPVALLRDTEFTLSITYSGRVEPQPADAETVALQQFGGVQMDSPTMAPEPSFLYSNEVDWYPKVSAADFATARIRLVVPAAFDCVASGDIDPSSPTLVPAGDGVPARKAYVFNAVQPIRYLAFIVSRFVRSQNVAIAFSPSTVPVLERPDGVSYRELTLSVEANPRMVGRGREVGDHAVDIAVFYQSLLDDGPYPSFTIAVVESERPGGHSPAYFASLNEPVAGSPYSWRNDPASFDSFPDFFLAHELAHQWWGQAVGWRTYHDQWISEGFSQYFAALYARRQRGEEVFGGMMRQMRKWAVSASGEGPISLGYRLGHIKGDGRVYRALVYNKGALVLHMLRQLVGDEQFLHGIRRFYSASRFKSVGTAEFQAAMEAATSRPLGRFFDRWVLGSTLPRVKFGYQVEGAAVLLHVEQVGELFDMPVAVTLRYTDKSQATVIIPVTERTADLRVPLAGTLRSAEINPNDGAILELVKN